MDGMAALIQGRWPYSIVAECTALRLNQRCKPGVLRLLLPYASCLSRCTQQHCKYRCHRSDKHIGTYTYIFSVIAVCCYPGQWAEQSCGQKCGKARHTHHKCRACFAGDPPDKCKLNSGASYKGSRLSCRNGNKFLFPVPVHLSVFSSDHCPLLRSSAVYMPLAAA